MGGGKSSVRDLRAPVLRESARLALQLPTEVFLRCTASRILMFKAHRMLLGTGLCQVCSDGCSPHRMLLGTGRYQVGSDGCLPYRMLLGTRRYQFGNDGCLPHRMLLRTERCQVGRICISPIFLKNERLHTRTSHVVAFKPPLQHAEMLLSAHENATKRTKTPGAWHACHQLVGTPCTLRFLRHPRCTQGTIERNSRSAISCALRLHPVPYVMQALFETGHGRTHRKSR